MTARVSVAEARALGIDVKTLTRRTRKTAAGPYLTRCVDCAQVFTTRTAEDRHVAPGHTRYELILEGTTSP